MSSANFLWDDFVRAAHEYYARITDPKEFPLDALIEFGTKRGLDKEITKGMYAAKCAQREADFSEVIERVKKPLIVQFLVSDLDPEAVSSCGEDMAEYFLRQYVDRPHGIDTSDQGNITNTRVAEFLEIDRDYFRYYLRARDEGMAFSLALDSAKRSLTLQLSLA